MCIFVIRKGRLIRIYKEVSLWKNDLEGDSYLNNLFVLVMLCVVLLYVCVVFILS